MSERSRYTLNKAGLVEQVLIFCLLFNIHRVNFDYTGASGPLIMNYY